MSGVAPERLRALVVEDERTARDYLVELLDGSGLAQVVGAVASAAEARAALHAGGDVFDVVFLDIRLSGGRNEGLDIARELAATPNALAVVLATAFSAPAGEVYDLGVADYLLKPFTPQRVDLCLERLHLQRTNRAAATNPLAAPPATDGSLGVPAPQHTAPQHTAPQHTAPQHTATGPVRIVARKKKSLVFFDIDEVWAFEAIERLTQVHTNQGIFDIDLSLSAIEASFGRGFARVHRNWLVNVGCIKELERDGETRIWIGDGVTTEDRRLCVPVARDRALHLRALLTANAHGLRRGP